MKMPIMMQLLLGTLLYTAGYVQLGFAGGAIAIAIAVAVVTLGEIIVQPALYTATSSETNSANAGRMMSISSLMRGMAFFLGKNQMEAKSNMKIKTKPRYSISVTCVYFSSVCESTR